MRTVTAHAAAAAVRACNRTTNPTVQRIRRRVERAVPRDTEDLVVTRDGMRLRLDLQDNLQRELFFRGSYERPLAELLLAEARPDDVFVDVGANIGIHAVRLASRVGRVIAFEAAPDTAGRLADTIERNGTTNVEIVNLALGQADGELELYASTRWGDGDLGVRSAFGDGPSVARVPMTTFDRWAVDVGGEVRPDIVKIDVEGAEYDVLVGMERSLSRPDGPRLVIVEVVEDFLRRAGTGADAVDAIMQRCGLIASGPDARTTADHRTGDLWPNVVYRRVSG